MIRPCPRCGGASIQSTCIGLIGGTDEDHYRVNYHTCSSCRMHWKGDEYEECKVLQYVLNDDNWPHIFDRLKDLKCLRCGGPDPDCSDCRLADYADSYRDES